MKRVLAEFRVHGPRALIFLSGSVMAQGTAAISGLLLARWLTVPDYAIYSVMMALITAMMLLTKGGTNIGYVAILGRVWPDMERAAEAVAALLTMRRIISLLALPPVVLITAILLLKNGVGLLLLVLLVLMLLIAWWADMQTRLVEQILYFAHQTTRVQLLDFALAALRLAAILALYTTGLLTVLSAVLLGVLVMLARVRPIVRWVRNLLPAETAAVREADLSEIRLSVRRQLPVEIYAVLRTQLVFLVLSFMASVDEVAGFGALTRINQLLVPVNMFTVAFCVPIFARATQHLTRLLAGLTIVTLLPGFALMLIAFLAPQVVLWLVGDNYAHLETEVFLAAGLATTTQGANTFRQLVGNRGWVRFNWLQIPLGLLWVVTSPIFLNLSTLRGALGLQLGFAVIIAAISLLDYATQAFKYGKEGTES